MTRLLLVDDHASSREPLALLLAAEPGIDRVMQASTVAEALPCLAASDVAIVDLGLPDGDGVTIIHRLRHQRADTPILVLTASFDPQLAARAIAAGAAVVLNKTIALDTLRRMLRRLMRGEAPEIGDGCKRAPLPSSFNGGSWRLSPREYEVLQALTDGLTDKEIGQRLGIGTETVRTYMTGIFSKLGVESRLQALAFALRQGLVVLRPTDD